MSPDLIKLMPSFTSLNLRLFSYFSKAEFVSVINAQIEQIEHLTHLIETCEDNAKLYIIRQVCIADTKSTIEWGCNNASEK